MSKEKIAKLNNVFTIINTVLFVGVIGLLILILPSLI
mgnify:CR=1 FL=1